MAEETESEAFAFTGALNNAGDIGHDETLMVVIADDTQGRLQRCEGIVGDLRTGTGEGGEERRLTGIGKADETDICQKFQLEDDRHLLHGLSRLCIARCLVSGGAELKVAKATAAALEKNHLLTVVGDVTDILARFRIVDDGATGNIDVDILTVGAVAFITTTIATMFGEDMPLVFQMEEGPVVMVAAQDHAAAMPTVTTVGTTIGVVLHVAQMHGSSASLS